MVPFPSIFGFPASVLAARNGTALNEQLWLGRHIRTMRQARQEGRGA